MTSAPDTWTDWSCAKGAALVAPAMGLEDLLTSPEGFGLVTATAVQRALCRVADGLPLGELADDEDVRAAFVDVAGLPCLQPAELYVLSGIRTGKSLIAAALAVRATQTCDVSRLGHGEVPRVSVLSLKLDLSRVIRDHIIGNIMARPGLRSLLMGEPTADTVVLRHPTGRPVEIKIVAGSRAGASLVARWSAGCIFDEAPRMVGQEDGVVNFDDARAAVLGRLLPGAQIVAIGSPWAPFGPIYDAVVERWGKPGSDLVVARAKAQAMNPLYWTEARIADLRERDPAVYRTDVLGEFADPESALFTAGELHAVTRHGALELEPDPAHHYVATMDPATRGNAWTLIVATRDDEDRCRICMARQWRGSTDQPLSPDAVLGEIADLVRPYRVAHVVSDQWAADALSDLAIQHGIYIECSTVTAPSKVAQFESLRALVADGRIELSPAPELQEDLRRVRKVVTQSGLRIELPRTADGRHCDYAPAVAMAAAQPCAKPVRLVAETHGRSHDEAARLREAIERNGRRGRRRNEHSTYRQPEHAFYAEAG